MDYKEEIVQIMPAPKGLTCVIASKDKKTKYGFTSLCYAIIKTDNPDAEQKTRIAVMVMGGSGGFTEATKQPGFIGLTFDPHAQGKKPLTKSDIERLDQRNGGDPQ